MSVRELWVLRESLGKYGDLRFKKSPGGTWLARARLSRKPSALPFFFFSITSETWVSQPFESADAPAQQAGWR